MRVAAYNKESLLRLLTLLGTHSLIPYESHQSSRVPRFARRPLATKLLRVCAAWREKGWALAGLVWLGQCGFDAG